MRGHPVGDEHFFQSQGAARDDAVFGDPTDKFRLNQLTIRTLFVTTKWPQNCIVIYLLVMFSTSSYGLDLGQPVVNSKHNQPLQVDIPLLNISSIPTNKIVVRDQNEKNQTDKSLDNAIDSQNFIFKVLKRNKGTGLLRITTKDPIQLPSIKLQLDITWPRGSIQRSYTLLFDPGNYQSWVSTGIMTKRQIDSHDVKIERFEKPDVEINIQEIQLTGDVLYPEYGIDQTFTDQVIQETLNTFEIDLPSKITIDRLYDIAQAISVRFRKQGLAFNLVTFKPQRLANDRIYFTVTNGRLADIQVYNNDLYADDLIKDLFNPILNKTAYAPNIKHAINNVKRLSGIKLFSYYSQGDNPGEVRLNIRLIEQTPVNRYIEADNYGIDETGKHRLSYFQTNNNPLGRGGQSNLIATLSETADSLLGVVQYRFPYFKRSGTLGFQLASSQYDIGGQFKDFGLSGRMVAGSALFQPWHKSHSLRSSWLAPIHQIGMTLVHSTLESDFASLSSLEEETSHLTLSVKPRLPHLPNTEFLNLEHWRWSTDLNIIAGHVADTDEPSVDDSFLLLRLNTALTADLKPYAISHLGIRRIAWKSKLQLSEQILPSSESFTMTGLTGVKGYSSGLFSPHTGVYSALSLQSKAKRFRLGESLQMGSQLTLFFDASYGIDNFLGETLTNSQSEAGFSSAGAAIKLQINNDLFINGQVAAPLHNFGYSTLGDVDLDEWQTYISLKYRL